MLKRVFIRSGFSDQDCENFVNKIIEDYPNCVVSFEMLIENSITAMYGKPQVTYTLMVQIEEEE